MYVGYFWAGLYCFISNIHIVEWLLASFSLKPRSLDTQTASIMHLGCFGPANIGIQTAAAAAATAASEPSGGVKVEGARCSFGMSSWREIRGCGRGLQ